VASPAFRREIWIAQIKRFAPGRDGDPGAAGCQPTSAEPPISSVFAG